MSVQKKSSFGFFLILLLSYITYFKGYSEPADLFWDENYHIASAQRYLNGIFFLEPHPPLGKLLIAVGEEIFEANAKNDQFVKLEKAEYLPEGFSFLGYRFFPALAAMLIAPLLYLIVLNISNQILTSILVSLFSVFDNALIVHNRGAMLEAPQLLFILLGVYAYLKLRILKYYRLVWSLALGISCALALTIKINSAVILIFPLIILIEIPEFKSWLLRCILPIFFTYLFVWQLHFLIAKKVEPSLTDRGYFEVSSEYKKVLNQNESGKPSTLFLGIKEAFNFSNNYQKGVPKLDLCKDDENGSSPLGWPLGIRSINYRWKEFNNKTSYLYLVINPISWLVGLIGVISSVLLMCLNAVKDISKKRLIILFLATYIVSWLAPLLMQRVFYLYHYFIPLVVSWILFAISLSYCSLRFQRIVYTFNVPLLIISYLWFKPLTYYEPITNKQLKDRSIFSFWDIHCKDCERSFHLSCNGAEKNQSASTSPVWSLKLGPIDASKIVQTKGTPFQSKDTFEVLTNSKIEFLINKNFKRVSGVAQLAKDNSEQPVQFSILADQAVVWSEILDITKEDSKDFDLDIRDVRELEFRVENLISGERPSAALWKELKLQ